ncbi:phosphate regulon transcriptional regulator PhoB [Orrella sp. 11846]|uniref:phosphate regulon transcriptional regulator PhoB n=1 Tax=Orrella sp. 11846 TaxID=3409913 RepID=UPI003B59E252
MHRHTILIIDDETSIREMLAFSLQNAGFDVLHAQNSSEALEILRDHQTDLILLDWMMPGLSGVELVKRLRQTPQTTRLPIIMLTAREQEDDKVRGLDAGADDYITKPFSVRELISRIKAALRQVQSSDQTKKIKLGNLCLDQVSQCVTADDKIMALSPTEFRLMSLFMNNLDRAYSRAQLLDLVWGMDSDIVDRTVDVHVLRLRKILAKHGYNHWLQTVRGIGYRFSVPKE